MDTLKAVVQKVIPRGAHGPFVVATSDQLEGSVTFSLEPTVWKEKEWPEEGMVVFLDELRKKRAGWRAKHGRFWKPSDEQGERSTLMKFLYPTARQFPFDEECAQIVRELERRNWKVPGITVEIHHYGSGEQKFRRVDTVEGKDFRLWYCRGQGRIAGSEWNDAAAISHITIRNRELRVYEDGSGPSFYPDIRKDHLNADRNANFRKIFSEFQKYLADVVLKHIRSCPIPSEKIDVLAQPAPIPFPASIGPIFCFAEWQDAERIKTGKKDAHELHPGKRYSLQGGGRRLVPLGDGVGNLPKIAFEGFLWCGIGEVTAETPIGSLKVYGHDRWSDRERFVIRVKPNRANDIYVADHAVYENRRVEIMERTKDEKRDRFTNAEVRDFVSARGRTIIPITEYKGDYKQPIVLINRELGFDEVEIVSGPHKSEMEMMREKKGA